MEVHDPRTGRGRYKARRWRPPVAVTVPRRPKRHLVTPDNGHRARGAPNLRARPCAETQPHPVRAGARTEVWTAEAWFYGAVLLD
jgi:hypothetical protein